MGKKYISSFNYNDIFGLLFIILFLSLFFILYKYLQTKNKNYLIINIIIFSFIVILINIKPIIFLYSLSSLISCITYTPEFLSLKDYFPNHVLFENTESFSLLKMEVTNMLLNTNQCKEITLTKDTYSGENSYIGSDIKIVSNEIRGWRILNIKVGNIYSPDSIHFPHLVNLLDKTPEIKSCVISILEPGIHIPMHVGYYKGILRYMIPTHVPKEREKVFLELNGIKYNWTEGKGVLWDDTFCHQVYNNSDENRIVVYMDIIRPLGIFNKLNNYILNLVSHSKIVKEEIQRTEIKVKIK